MTDEHTPTIMRERPQTAFERHAQTALVMLVIAVLVWVGQTTQQTAITVAEMAVEISYLKTEVTKPDGKFLEIERRLDAIEKKLNKMDPDNEGV